MAAIPGTWIGNGKCKRAFSDPYYRDHGQFARRGEPVTYGDGLEEAAKARWAESRFMPDDAELVSEWQDEAAAKARAEAEAAAGLRAGATRAAVAQELKDNPALLVDALKALSPEDKKTLVAALSDKPAKKPKKTGP